jgi:hypothetical protein
LDDQELDRLLRLAITPHSSGEIVHAFLYCYFEKIALTIRFLKKLGNGKFFVEEFEALPYDTIITPNGKMLLLIEESYYKLVEETYNKFIETA